MPVLKENIQDNKKILFIDDFYKKKTCNDIKVIKFNILKELDSKPLIYLAISSYSLRRKIFKNINKYYKNFPNLISNKSLIFESVKIGRGNLISPFCTIGSNTKIGNFNHINLYSYIEHDCKVGNYVTLAPGVKCNGYVIIEDDVFIGSGAIIGNGTEKNPIIIGKGSVIGAGSIVLKSIPRFSKVIAYPSKRIPKLEN